MNGGEKRMNFWPEKSNPGVETWIAFEKRRKRPDPSSTAQARGCKAKCSQKHCRCNRNVLAHTCEFQVTTAPLIQNLARQSLFDRLWEE